MLPTIKLVPAPAKVTFCIDDHLIIPFGCPKWEIDKIRVTGVSTDGTYFASETPLAYIDRTKKSPLRLTSITRLLPDAFPKIADADLALDAIRERLSSLEQIQTDSERLFLDLYFDYCKETAGHILPWALKHLSTKDPNWRFAALVPLPQAHLYVDDPLDDSFPAQPNKMIRFDFAFWTGKRIVAVEIDGISHVGDPDHVRRDRMLQLAGVHVIHIMNEELRKHGRRALVMLLPPELTHYRDNWVDKNFPPGNPLR